MAAKVRDDQPAPFGRQRKYQIPVRADAREAVQQEKRFSFAAGLDVHLHVVEGEGLAGVWSLHGAD